MSRTGVLYLCTGNSCRSQMAEGWTRALHPDRYTTASAGVKPYGIDPRAVRVMEEAGVDISGHASKHVEDLRGESFDYVVTVCDNARESCPIFPARVRLLHRPFDDPPRLARDARTEEEALEHYRRVRDEIRAFVRRLPETLDEGKGR